MKKILVVGSGGAGKSTFARELGTRLNIEVIHLDKFFWGSGWIRMDKSAWLKTIERLVKPDTWIMDGNYSGTLDIRFEACDTVVFLDMSRWLCLWRMLKRVIVYRNKVRPDMAEGCRERPNLEFIIWIWNYSKRTKPKIVRMLASDKGKRNIVWLRSQSQVERFFSGQI
jgi:adenylate kinase family enzyme